MHEMSNPIFWWYFSYFSQKIKYDISCKLSPKETICMKCQILFSGKNKKNISKCCMLKFFTQHAKRCVGLYYENVPNWAFFDSNDPDQSMHIYR